MLLSRASDDQLGDRIADAVDHKLKPGSHLPRYGSVIPQAGSFLEKPAGLETRNANIAGKGEITEVPGAERNSAERFLIEEEKMKFNYDFSNGNSRLIVQLEENERVNMMIWNQLSSSKQIYCLVPMDVRVAENNVCYIIYDLSGVTNYLAWRDEVTEKKAAAMEKKMAKALKDLERYHITRDMLFLGDQYLFVNNKSQNISFLCVPVVRQQSVGNSVPRNTSQNSGGRSPMQNPGGYPMGDQSPMQNSGGRSRMQSPGGYSMGGQSQMQSSGGRSPMQNPGGYSMGDQSPMQNSGGRSPMQSPGGYSMGDQSRMQDQMQGGARDARQSNFPMAGNSPLPEVPPAANPVSMDSFESDEQMKKGLFGGKKKQRGGKKFGKGFIDPDEFEDDEDDGSDGSFWENGTEMEVPWPSRNEGLYQWENSSENESRRQDQPDGRSVWETEQPEDSRQEDSIFVSPVQSSAAQWNSSEGVGAWSYDNGEDKTTILNRKDDGSAGTVLLVRRPQFRAKLERLKTREVFSIEKSPCTIGKFAAEVDICIRNNPTVSRVHCTIHYINGAYYIEDNNSTNETYLDGIRIPAGEKMKLSDGCRIVMSDEEFVFNEVKPDEMSKM